MHVLTTKHQGASVEQGTSLANPLVGGTIGLVMSCDPTIRKSEVIATLQDQSHQVAGLNANLLDIEKVVKSICLGSSDYNDDL